MRAKVGTKMHKFSKALRRCVAIAVQKSADKKPTCGVKKLL